jgi:hypothetical protein
MEVVRWTSRGHGVGASSGRWIGVSGGHGAGALQGRGVGAFQGRMMDAPPERGIVTFSGRGIVSLPGRGVERRIRVSQGHGNFILPERGTDTLRGRRLGAFPGHAILIPRGSGLGVSRIMLRMLFSPPSPPLVALQTMVQQQSWQANHHYEQMDGVVALQSIVM